MSDFGSKRQPQSPDADHPDSPRRASTDVFPRVDELDRRAREIMPAEYGRSEMELVLVAYIETPNPGPGGLEIPRVGTALTVHWVAAEDALMETMIRPPGTPEGFESGSIRLAAEEHGIEPIDGEPLFGGPVSDAAIDLADIRRIASERSVRLDRTVRGYALRRLPVAEDSAVPIGSLVSEEQGRQLREEPVWTVWTGALDSEWSTVSLYGGANGDLLLSVPGTIPELSVQSVLAASSTGPALKALAAGVAGYGSYAGWVYPILWLIALVVLVIWLIIQLAEMVKKAIESKLTKAEEVSSSQRRKELKREAAELEKLQTELYAGIAELQKVKRQADRARDRGEQKKAKKKLKEALKKMKEIRDLIKKSNEVPKVIKDGIFEELNDRIEQFEKKLAEVELPLDNRLDELCQRANSLVDLIREIEKKIKELEKELAEVSEDMTLREVTLHGKAFGLVKRIAALRKRSNRLRRALNNVNAELTRREHDDKTKEAPPRTKHLSEASKAYFEPGTPEEEQPEEDEEEEVSAEGEEERAEVAISGYIQVAEDGSITFVTDPEKKKEIRERMEQLKEKGPEPVEGWRRGEPREDGKIPYVNEETGEEWLWDPDKLQWEPPGGHPDPNPITPEGRRLAGPGTI